MRTAASTLNNRFYLVFAAALQPGCGYSPNGKLGWKNCANSTPMLKVFTSTQTKFSGVFTINKPSLKSRQSNKISFSVELENP